jgi:aryl carrier-like protein
MPYLRDVGFAGITKSRKAYEAAMVTFNSELASLKSFYGQLNAPAAAAAAAGAAAELGAAAVKAAVPGIIIYQSNLQAAAEALQEALQELDSKAPLQQQVQEWGGSVQQWQQIIEFTQIGLDPVQMCSWFGKLRQQREVTLQALKQLQRVPQTSR